MARAADAAPGETQEFVDQAIAETDIPLARFNYVRFVAEMSALHQQA
jgi:hypothetical protein